MELVDDDYTSAIVGDANGVRDAAEVPPDDNDFACDKACVGRTHRCEDVFDDASGVPDSVRVLYHGVLYEISDDLPTSQALQALQSRIFDTLRLQTLQSRIVEIELCNHASLKGRNPKLCNHASLANTKARG
jgi:hypothetical protein